MLAKRHPYCERNAATDCGGSALVVACAAKRNGSGGVRVVACAAKGDGSAAGEAVKEKQPLTLTEVPSPEGSILIPYEIRRSAHSRYIRLTLGDLGQARLTVPRHCSQSAALAFLRTQGAWLHKQLQKAPPRVSLRSYLSAHAYVYGLGHTLSVKFGRTSGRSYYLYSLRPAEILFQLHYGEDVDPEVELLAQLRAFAQEVIPQRTQEFAQKHGIRLQRVSVRDQSSRWGSCSTSGTVSLNWRLVLLRSHLQDHVILHELAHLKEMNHSERFWNLLRSYDPYCDAHNSQLNVAATKVMPLGRGIGK